MGSRLPHTFPEVAKLAVAAGWSGWQVVTATAVARAESGLDGYAVGVVGSPTRPDGTPNPAYRSLDVGLWQINTYWWPSHKLSDLLDPIYNAGAAGKMWQAKFAAVTGTYAVKVHEAWSAWAVYSAGAHEPYMPAAVDAAREIGAVK